MPHSFSMWYKYCIKGEVYGKRDLAPSFTTSKDLGRRNDMGNGRDKSFKRKKVSR